MLRERSGVQQHLQGVFQHFRQSPSEARGIGAVDHSVIIGERKRQHEARHDLALVHDRL
jgi:hypothetical protein